MKSVNLKTKITLLIFSLLVFFTLITAYYIFDNVVKNVTVQIENTLRQSAIAKSKQVHSLIESNVSVLKSLARNEYLKNLDPREYAAFIQSYKNELFTEISVIDANGFDYVNNKIYLKNNDDFFNVAMHGKTYLGNIFIDDEMNKASIDIAIPIIKGPNVVGVVRGVIDADKLSYLINTDMPFPSSYAYIINSKREFIAHKNDIMLTESNKADDIFSENKIQNRNIINFYKYNANKKNGFGNYELNKETFFVAFNKIESTDWRIYVTADKNAALASINQIRKNYLIFAAFIVFIALMTALFVGDNISHPIIELSNNFIAASEGDLNIRSHYKSNDEIGTLSDSFNILMEEINQLTFYDKLTNLPNTNILRAKLIERKQKKYNCYDTLVLISINHFSKINEFQGVKTGDKILIEIAKRLEKVVGEQAKLYKGRGDEYFISMKDISQNSCEFFMEKISQTLSKPFIANRNTILIKYAIGIFRYNAAFSDIDIIIKNVTHANNLSKQDANMKWRWYNEDSHANMKRRLEIENNLTKAIKNNEMFLVFQPIINVKMNHVEETEVLLRWKNKTMGFISPEIFIALAEESGYIKEIDYYVFEEACKQLSIWTNDIVLSINVSAVTFESDDYITFVKNTIKKHNINPHKIQIELTERSILNNPDSSIIKMQTLQNLGFKIALDDFGVGYSSLSYLVKLPINLVKIDKSFIRGMNTDQQATNLLNAIINMCQTLNLAIVAEGVETKDELNYLESKDLELIQGYYFSKPISKDDFDEGYIKTKALLPAPKKL